MYKILQTLSLTSLQPILAPNLCEAIHRLQLYDKAVEHIGCLLPQALLVFGSLQSWQMTTCRTRVWISGEERLEARKRRGSFPDGVVERAVLHGGGLSDFDVDKAAGGGAEVLVAVDT